MDNSTVVTLLTVTVILLSVVIIALLTAVTLVLVKIKRIAKTVDEITQNVAAATEWFSPMGFFSNLVHKSRKTRK
ncbi:MAG TPA: hypothetical protein VJ841_03090 [Candidatus Saccharimonadales bacterium]|nr:hypothetical protein [Candidatus Saccharimonadales bacterium]